LFQSATESCGIKLPNNKNIHKLHEKTIKSSDEFYAYVDQIAYANITPEETYRKISDTIDHITNQEFYQIIKKDENFKEALEGMRKNYLILKDHKL
jgi:hypothetical protein